MKVKYHFVESIEALPLEKTKETADVIKLANGCVIVVQEQHIGVYACLKDYDDEEDPIEWVFTGEEEVDFSDTQIPTTIDFSKNDIIKVLQIGINQVPAGFWRDLTSKIDKTFSDTHKNSTEDIYSIDDITNNAHFKEKHKNYISALQIASKTRLCGYVQFID